MKTIAIVEDNPDNLELLMVLLEDDYELSSFDNGPDALAAFAEHEPDLVLMDISLPGMDGVEVLHRAREKTPELRAIALTAHAMRGDRERFMEAGFDAYLSKPIVDEDEFFATIERVIK